MPDFKPLIGYIIDQVQEKGGTVGRTALMKLVYLADVEHFTRYGRTATGLKWRFYHYGPYAAELEQIFQSLGVDFDEQEFKVASGNRQLSGFRYNRTGDWREVHRKFNSEYNEQVKRSVDRVVDQWALEPLWSILDYVYFESEPMQGAERGEYLDFSKIDREHAVRRPSPALSAPRQDYGDLRRRMVERKERRRESIRKPTEPAYDEVYAEAYKTMEEEEGRVSNVKPHTKLRRPEQE